MGTVKQQVTSISYPKEREVCLLYGTALLYFMKVADLTHAIAIWIFTTVTQ